MHKQLFILALSASLAACGGGSSGAVAPDYSTAVSSALGNTEKTLPAPSPAFLGAFCTVGNNAIGYVSGTSADDVALSVAKQIVAAPGNNAEAYKALLSEQGLSIVVQGGLSTMRSSVTGLFISLPDSKYVARLTSNGLTLKSA